MIKNTLAFLLFPKNNFFHKKREESGNIYLKTQPRRNYSNYSVQFVCFVTQGNEN